MIAGTWSINEYISPVPVLDGTVMMNSLFCIPGYYLIEECSPTSAGNNEWFVNTLLPELKEALAGEGGSVYDRLNAMAASLPAGERCPLFLPFLMGSNEQPGAHAAFVGVEGHHGRAHLVRGLYEGVAFSHRRHFDRLTACLLYTSRNSGGVPDNFRNWFVVEFDRDFEYTATFADGERSEALEQQAGHAGGIVGFRTRRGEQVTARVASSFISPEQALRNLQEVGERGFDEVCAAAKQRWNDVLGRIEIREGDLDHRRTFYTCLYRSTLFPRKFYEFDAQGRPCPYSPYNGEVLPLSLIHI